MTTTWTYVTRKQYGPFYAPSGFVGDWQEASDAAKAVLAADPKLDVYVTTTDATEVELIDGRDRVRTIQIRDVAAERAHRKAVADVVAYFERADANGWNDWLLKAAARWCDYRGTDHAEAARQLLEYYTDRPGHRAKDGWTITTDPAVMRSHILRACS